MKKAELQASNDAIRTDPDLISPDELCDNLDQDLENGYGTIRIESSAYPVWTIPVLPLTRPYWFQIVKQGRNFVMPGWVKNGTGSTLPAGSGFLEFPLTVSGNPSDLIPDNSIDPFTSNPVLFRFIGRTPTGSEAEFGIGYRSGTGKYELFALSDVPPNTSSVSRYQFSPVIIVKE